MEAYAIVVGFGILHIQLPVASAMLSLVYERVYVDEMKTFNNFENHK